MKTAIQNLLHQIIDYAGLFPPAGLPLAAVIKNYEKYVPADHNWMLARLIIPAGKLEEFAKDWHQLFPDGLDHPSWKISALIPPVSADSDGFLTAIENIEKFNFQHSFASVDTVEGKLPTADLVDETCERLLPSLSAFLEIPWRDRDQTNETIVKLAANSRDNTFAKIRTGGVTADLIPDSSLVANFIHSCAAANLGLKATAGLHHPLRGEYALTYQTNAERGIMHGFMNVFMAVCFAKQHSWSQQQLTELLDQADAGAFAISDDQIEYQGQAVSSADIKLVRESFAVSFGSCSFIEPIEYLIQLGWLADAAKTV